MNNKLNISLKHHFVLSIVLLFAVIGSIIVTVFDFINNESSFSSLGGEGTSSSSIYNLLRMVLGVPTLICWVLLIIMASRVNTETKDSMSLLIFSVIYIPILTNFLSFSAKKKLLNMVINDDGIKTMSSETLDPHEKKLYQAFQKKLLTDDEYEFQSNLYKRLKNKEITNEEYSKLLKDSYKKNL